jgi:hypothetical protein
MSAKERRTILVGVENEAREAIEDIADDTLADLACVRVRLNRIRNLHSELFAGTESFEPLGVNLAYLYGAIAGDQVVALAGNDPLRTALAEFFEPGSWIWDYITEEED